MSLVAGLGGQPAESVVLVDRDTGEALDLFSLSGAKAAAVAVVDASGNQITSFGSPLGAPAVSFDYISLTQAATTDTYEKKTGGSGGTTVQTITVTFTDSTKATIANVAWT